MEFYWKQHETKDIARVCVWHSLNACVNGISLMSMVIVHGASPYGCVRFGRFNDTSYALCTLYTCQSVHVSSANYSFFQLLINIQCDIEIIHQFDFFYLYSEWLFRLVYWSNINTYMFILYTIGWSWSPTSPIYSNFFYC